MASLFEELGLDPETFEWHDLSLCRGIDITGPSDDVFFDRYETDSESAKAADDICLHCPVIKQCFAEGADGKYGLWGGVYWNGSGSPDRNRNSHKTDEVWAEIYRKVGKQ